MCVKPKFGIVFTKCSVTFDSRVTSLQLGSLYKSLNRACSDYVIKSRISFFSGDLQVKQVKKIAISICKIV